MPQWNPSDEGLQQPTVNLLQDPRLVLTNNSTYTRQSALADVLAKEIPQTNGYTRPALTVTSNSVSNGVGTVTYQTIQVVASGGQIVFDRAVIVTDIGGSNPKWAAYTVQPTTLEDGESAIFVDLELGTGALGTAFNGLPGENAFATTIADYTQPAAGSTVVVSLSQGSTFLAPGMDCFYGNGTLTGWYSVSAIGGTTATLQNLGIANSSPPGTQMTSGGQIVVAGRPGTDQGGGTGGGVSLHYRAQPDTTVSPTDGNCRLVASPDLQLNAVTQFKFANRDYHYIAHATDEQSGTPDRPTTVWFNDLSDDSLVQLTGADSDEGKQAWYKVTSVTVGADILVNVTFQSESVAGAVLTADEGFAFSVKEPKSGGGLSWQGSNPVGEDILTANDAGDPANDLSFSIPGTRSIQVTDGTNWYQGLMGTPGAASTIVKQLDAVFAEGTGAGGRAAADALADGEWFAFQIFKANLSSYDYLFTNSFSDNANLAPKLPTDYLYWRLIWWFVRDAGAILPFRQEGEWYRRVFPADTSADGSTQNSADITVFGSTQFDCPAQVLCKSGRSTTGGRVTMAHHSVFQTITGFALNSGYRTETLAQGYSGFDAGATASIGSTQYYAELYLVNSQIHIEVEGSSSSGVDASSATTWRLDLSKFRRQ